MHFIYTFFIALANNIDNISVRIAYSIRGIKISIFKNIWISIITFFISSLAAFSGSIITDFFSTTVSQIISMLMLVFIGLWIIVEPYFNTKKVEINSINIKNDNIIRNILRNPEKADKDNSKDIDFKEATFLGIALSINNIGGGMSAGMIGLSSPLVGFFSAIISFLSLWAGNYLTSFLNRWNLNKKATVLAGLLLIIIGVKQVI